MNSWKITRFGIRQQGIREHEINPEIKAALAENE
jgi:hypothetical protein